MSKVNIQIEELKAAIAEIESRTGGLKISMEADGRRLMLTAVDRNDNMIEVILFEDSALGAQFRYTERLMFMKDKKRM